jgi:hypothetical protein
MEYIGIKRIMDRLLVNPNLKALQTSTVAAYVKDFSSINGIIPILRVGYNYFKIEEYKTMLPENCLEVKKVYLCDEEWLDDAYFEDNSLNAALSSSMIREEDKITYGDYKVENNMLFLDIMETVVEVRYTLFNVDDQGLPMLPYDGSLMEAIMSNG